MVVTAEERCSQLVQDEKGDGPFRGRVECRLARLAIERRPTPTGLGLLSRDISGGHTVGGCSGSILRRVRLWTREVDPGATSAIRGRFRRGRGTARPPFGGVISTPRGFPGTGWLRNALRGDEGPDGLQ
jgi:hypothetical protein